MIQNNTAKRMTKCLQHVEDRNIITSEEWFRRSSSRPTFWRLCGHVLPLHDPSITSVEPPVPQQHHILDGYHHFETQTSQTRHFNGRWTSAIYKPHSVQATVCA